MIVILLVIVICVIVFILYYTNSKDTIGPKARSVSDITELNAGSINVSGLIDTGNLILGPIQSSSEFATPVVTYKDGTTKRLIPGTRLFTITMNSMGDISSVVPGVYSPNTNAFNYDAGTGVLLHNINTEYKIDEVITTSIVYFGAVYSSYKPLSALEEINQITFKSWNFHIYTIDEDGDREGVQFDPINGLGTSSVRISFFA